ncbi:oxysterol-binding protein [Colletotrichum lupini]|uniref:Oxysterol-binding protein n=1 Tax=Colletotrichum lupini TaxID=145971 RepID=A0A9Q8STG8_9PEZI|nr:oxysterol-binding protein [Colletotrichum lupini]UQC83221.1 oxysterol-binding protein [Colletotrichum lupini]
MSDAGDSEEDPSTTDDGAPLTSPPSTAASATNISMAQNVPRGNGANRLSISPSMGRTPSHNSPPSATASTSASKMSVAGSEKGVSLEQSVRKFRIVEALRSGDTASISKAIRDTAEGGPRTSISSINTLSGTGLDDTTVLHLAIQCAEYPVVEYVLSDGAGTIDINARDKDGNTPLHVAAVQGRTQVVKLLLDQKEINDAIANYQGRLPIDVARNPDIFQLLQLSRSIFAENKVRQIQGLIAQNDYKALETVLEESRLKQILDINSTEFVTEPTTLQAGGNLLHEAARKKNTQLIQVLLLHGADPFRRDRKGKLPQDVTKDDTTRAMLKRSPAAVAAQRGIQEKAVLGQAASQGAGAAASADPVAGKEAREMKGYLKKWTNYRKGYQLRWFVLEDGVLSYYKHQDDAGSACRGAINTRIAKLHMSADEKTKFEIIGKSSVKYTLKANHEVEAKRWFWALNNSIQWTKDQAKEEERQRARGAELLRQAKAEQSGKSPELSINEAQSESASVADGRSSVQIPRTMSHSKMSVPRSDFAGASTVASNDDDFADAATDAGQSRVTRGHHGPDDDDDDDDFEDVSSREEPSVSKDAFSITAQSAKLQLDTISAVNAAMLSEASKNPNTIVSDTKVTQALTTYDAAVRSLTGLIGDLMRISKDRDAYWQYRLDREIDMRRMWEESMAKVAKEQEILEERVDQAEQKRKAAKRALREVMNEQPTATSQDLEGDRKVDGTATVEAAIGADDTNIAAPPAAPERTLTRKKTVLDSLELSDSESDDEDEFFDAVDAGEVEVSHLPHADAVPTPHEEKEEQQLVVSGGTDLSSSFRGYENGIRSRLKMDADDRLKISLWGILKSMIGKDMTKMTLPVSFNEPTSLLYRAGEDMEYVDLLDQAVERSDSIERLIYVAAFAASEYASTVGRVAKPFNPLLGETFEYVRPDKNYRFFIEQVSHHPPVGAAWAESPHWTYWGESAVKTKFYGKSFDANPLGTWFLKLRPKSGGKEDLYTWRKVTTSVIGIITGNPTVDNYGPMEVKNWTTGEVCQIEFQPRGWKASSAYKISGKVLDSDGRVRYSMGGRWNSKLYARLTPGYEATVEDPGDSASLHKGSITDPNKAFLIWQANPRPPGIPFNLTPFVLTFNHIDDKLKPWLPPTDSRLRPDQRAMEDGEYDFAAEEKNRLEEAQRARRKQREEKGIEFRPAWFEKTTCEITGEEYWKFNGKYWQQREKAGPEGNPQQAWEGLEPIYEDAK